MRKLITFVRYGYEEVKDFFKRLFKKDQQELIIKEPKYSIIESKKKELILDYHERCNKKMVIYKNMLSNEKIRSNIESLMKKRIETDVNEHDDEKYREELINEAHKLSYMYKENDFNPLVIELFDDMMSIAYKKFLGKSDQLSLEDIYDKNYLPEKDNEMMLFNSYNSEVIIYDKEKTVSNDIDTLISNELHKKVIKLYDKDLVIDDIFIVKMPNISSRFSIYRDKQKKLEYVVFPDGKYQVNPYDDFWKEDLQY